jgi:hypothetical protein
MLAAAFFNAYQMTYRQMLPRINEIGSEKHFNHFPAERAWAMDTPFQWTKQIASHLMVGAQGIEPWTSPV